VGVEAAGLAAGAVAAVGGVVTTEERGFEGGRG
jgi:hypothetical protein